MSQISKPRRQNRIASALLLALLVLNLVHSHSHFGSIAGLSTCNLNAAVSASKEGREVTNDKLQPCLACNCQKHSLAILSSLNRLLVPLRTSHSATELERFQELHPTFSLDPSRAPPQLA
jgi:hypothetical protein